MNIFKIEYPIISQKVYFICYRKINTPLLFKEFSQLWQIMSVDFSR